MGMGIGSTILGAVLTCLMLIYGCSDEAQDDPVATFSCDVSETTGAYDLSYCQDYQIVASQKAELQKTCEELLQGTFNDGAMCNVTTGTQGCVLTDNQSGQSYTVWLDGANWEPNANQSTEAGAICANATPVTKA